MPRSAGTGWRAARPTAGFASPRTRWRQGRYPVAQEHLATAVVDAVLGCSTDDTERPRDTTNALALVCAEGNWHGTSAHMAALSFRDVMSGTARVQTHLEDEVARDGNDDAAERV